MTPEDIQGESEADRKRQQEYLEKMMGTAGKTSEPATVAAPSVLPSNDSTTSQPPVGRTTVQDNVVDPLAGAGIDSHETFAHGSTTDELARLQTQVLDLSIQTDFVWHGAKSMSVPVRKRLMNEVASETFALSKSIGKIHERVNSSSEGILDIRKDLRKLQEDMDWQKQANYELMTKGIEDGVFATDEVGHLQNGTHAEGIEGQTLAEAMTQLDTPTRRAPERMSVFTIILQNKVNGEVITGPPNITTKDDWEVSYAMEDVKDDRLAREQFEAMLARVDSATMRNWPGKKLRQYYESWFYQKLRKLSKSGKQYRAQKDAAAKGKETVVFEARGP